MGAVTRIPSAVKMPAGRISHLSLRLRSANVILVATLAFTSAQASAGLVVLTPKPSPVVDSGSSSSTSSGSADTLDLGLAKWTSNDPILTDPVLPSYKPATTREWARNAAPANSSTPPLLIPLPTGMSAGALGLVALGLILAPRRIRRILLG